MAQDKPRGSATRSGSFFRIRQAVVFCITPAEGEERQESLPYLMTEYQAAWFIQRRLCHV